MSLLCPEHRLVVERCQFAFNMILCTAMYDEEYDVSIESHRKPIEFKIIKQIIEEMIENELERMSVRKDNDLYDVTVNYRLRYIRVVII